MQRWRREIGAGTWDYRLVEKVAGAVVTEGPDWVIQASRLQAEGLIERTQSKYYPHAAHKTDGNPVPKLI